MRLEDFVVVTENKAGMDVNKLVGVCKRRNNTKRSYLFVNNYQGKHIPQSPTEILGLYKKLCLGIKKDIKKGTRILVVGFAETATAIGNYMVDNLEGVVWGLQTTREACAKEVQLFTFEEEHSHAVNQQLCCAYELPEFDHVLFVEDEITTGKTVLNFVAKFQEIYPNKTFSVASFLNWQNEKDFAKFGEVGIKTHYLVKGTLKEAEVQIKDEREIVSVYPKGEKAIGKNVDWATRVGRLGYAPLSRKSLKTIEEEYLKDIGVVAKGNSILVVGTEEYMYEPLLVAKALEDKGYNVKFHATTRSPIVPSGVKDYTINTGVQIPSVYDRERITYLYNVNTYDKVLVVTDGPFLKDHFYSDFDGKSKNVNCNFAQAIREVFKESCNLQVFVV